MTDIRVVDDPAAFVARLLNEAAAAGRHIVLTGGSTPKLAYEIAASSQPDWSKATVWWGDERCVAPTDERSNYGMAAAALLDRLPQERRPRIMRMEGEKGPQAGADAYETQVMQALGSQPRFDLLLLGLGGDGHMASLFPGKSALQERERIVVGVPEAGLEPFVPRITFTVPAINAAERIVFLVTGADKAPAVAKAFGSAQEAIVPAGLSRDPLVVLDAAAAAELT